MLFAALLGFSVALGVACSSEAEGREIEVIAQKDACTPASATAAKGEKVTFVVKNHSGGDREFEGEEGTQLEEVAIPDGRERKINFTMPSDGTTQKFKCYIPNGPKTIIELKAS